MKNIETNATNSKKQNLYIFLSGLFLTNALIAEVVGTKIFSLEKTFGLNPAQVKLPIWDSPLDFNLTAGVMLWPVVFVMTDIINEYYGKKGVRKISFLTAGFIAYAFFMIWVVTGLSPATFWVEINNPLDINTAFNRIFLQSMGIIIGSLTAFLVGQIIDVVAFQWLRKFTGSKNLWFRATGSTLISQFIDSFVVLFIAFYFFGSPKWSFNQVVSVGIINYIYKFSIAILLTPILYLVHYLIDSYLGKQTAEEMIKEASDSELF